MLYAQIAFDDGAAFPYPRFIALRSFANVHSSPRTRQNSIPFPLGLFVSQSFSRCSPMWQIGRQPRTVGFGSGEDADAGERAVSNNTDQLSFLLVLGQTLASLRRDAVIVQDYDVGFGVRAQHSQALAIGREFKILNCVRLEIRDGVAW